MYYQIVQRDPRFGWTPLGDAVFIDTDDMKETDAKNAHDIAERILKNHKPSMPVVLLDGHDYEAVMRTVYLMNMGQWVQGFPAETAIELMGRLVGMHPLEAGPPGDHDKAYRFKAPEGELAIRTQVREWRRWKNLTPEDR